ncbi:hypothetical protein OIDMADRAFT_39531 [Oidiodendron maius Zn]|uniref:FAD-binding domain-containing protein n=1 Tax=Oidiodendron maius (strain Zn) TaxID=913774 RepID=A0A0C3HSE6_OIDMZ|nr:hypothetical protein OIDMADRAFT_39531 [Oidiodendron maius Zn]
MPDIRKALVIGAGPAGLAAAIQLKRKNGISCTVYEIHQEPTTLGGAIGIPSNGLRLLDRLGVYEPLFGLAANTVNTVAYSSKGIELGEIDLWYWAREKTGYGFMRVMRTDLQNMMLDAVLKEGIQIHYGKKMVSVEENDSEVIATFSDGTKDTADLLLGCDGIHSSVRTLYVDPQAEPEYSGLSAVFSFIHTSDILPTASTIRDMCGILTPDGVVGLMPCTASGDTLFWLFSYEVPVPAVDNTQDAWEERRKAEVEGFKITLLRILHDAQGEFGTLLKQVVRTTETVQFYPVSRLPLGRKWSKGRCLLLGDAAHAMQPHAGQGTSLAMEDVFLLSRLLQVHSYTLSDVFGKFDEIRRPRVEKFYKLALINGERRKRTGPWAQWFKELAFWAAIWVLRSTNLHKWGFGQGDLVYDVDDVVI